MLRQIFLSLALIPVQPILAQTPTQTSAPTIHTTQELKQIEARLMASAKSNPTGVAHADLDDFGTYHSMLVVRVHTGDAERHRFWADQIIINKGTITLVTGGTMPAETPNGNDPGEFRSSSIQGGTEVVLHAGDIVHIPANLPHWVKIAPGTTTTYFVFKEK